MSYLIEETRIVSDRIELPVADHCNLACRGCMHLSPVAPRATVKLDQVEADLAVLSHAYHAHEIRLLGGEPLLHPEITKIAAVAKASGVADRVYLVTNGLLLPRAPRALWQYVDLVEISVYPGHELAEATMAETLEILKAENVEVVANRVEGFLEPYSSQRTPDDGLIRRIYKTCQIAHYWGCHSVQSGYFYKCPQAHLIGLFGATDETWNISEDGVRLDDPNSLFDRVSAYLRSPEPLKACAYCLGSVGKLFPHEIIKRADWREPQKKSTLDLVNWEYLESLETVNPDPLIGNRTEVFSVQPSSKSDSPPSCSAETESTAELNSDQLPAEPEAIPLGVRIGGSSLPMKLLLAKAFGLLAANVYGRLNAVRLRWRSPAGE